MLRGIACHALVLIVCTASASMVAAAPAKKPAAKKPVAKPPAGRVVLGTRQLSGDQAVLGTEFTLGKTNPMNFKLDRVEYSASRLRIGDQDHYPSAEEKYLVLSFTLHNPQKNESTVRFDTFQFTAVDDTDTNREGRAAWGVTSNKQALNMRLKPGQKVAGYTFIAIPATASVPKLIVKARDNTVLRYDLRGKVKPLTGPALDPTVPGGVAALARIPAAFGAQYEMGELDITVESAAYSTDPLPGGPLRAGERFLVVTASVRNAIQRPRTVRFDSIEIVAVDVDGAETPIRGNMLRASSDEPFNSQVQPGSAVRLRMIAKAPKGITFKEMAVRTRRDQRAYVYDMSAVQ